MADLPRLELLRPGDIVAHTSAPDVEWVVLKATENHLVAAHPNPGGADTIEGEEWQRHSARGWPSRYPLPNIVVRFSSHRPYPPSAVFGEV